jgi:putative ABC transport system substrate-binding protein
MRSPRPVNVRVGQTSGARRDDDRSNVHLSSRQRVDADRGIMTRTITRLTTVVVVLLLLVAPFSAEAQPADTVPRVGFLLAGSRSDSIQRVVDDLRQGLRELGYVEGQTITIEYRWAEGKEERLPDLAAELVRLKVDVIVATIAAAVRAAKHATKAIPIVMVVNDPVAAGFVTTVARPGGNITGLSMMSPDVVGKQLELLREVVPKISRVAVLWNPANPGSAPQLRQAEVVARALRMQLQPLEAHSPSEIDRAFAAMTRERAGALLVLLDPILARHRERIAELAAKSRLPAMYALRLHVEAGGLMAYGANIFDLYRRAAIYVDKILKGAKPGDLPIEQPTKFELVINMKTAKALGLTIPSSLLMRADQVIE